MTKEQCFFAYFMHDNGYYFNEETKQMLKLAYKAFDEKNTIIEKYQKLLDSEEFNNADTPDKVRMIDQFCISEMRGLLGDYFADKI